ncbi:MAG: CCA tRNA nucleotidyltransferase [Bacteroidales bacterium]|nr:CCA tRNA nucleotidyltransferase [Bacteroidales bacterium]
MKVGAYVVGGYVRDLFMGQPSADIDVVVVGSGIELAKNVADRIGLKTEVTVFKNFGTAMINVFEEEMIQVEFVGARKESYRKDSRKPVVEDGTLEDDQRRRDFTINAMAISLSKDSWGEFIDPFAGIMDLDNGILRTPLDPEITFSDDPLRMMRAIRFSTQLDFTIDPETFLALKKCASRIKIVSAERITDELNKIMLSPVPSKGFRLLNESGLLPIILPWVHDLKGVEEVDGIGHKDNFYHTIKVLDNVAEKSDNLWLRWAAILHDVGKPVTKKFEEKSGWTFHGHDFVGAKMVPVIFRKLKMPLHDSMKYVKKLVLLHLRPIALSEDSVTDSAVRRLLFEAGHDADDLMILCEADITSKNKQKKERFLKNFGLVRTKLVEIEEKDRIRNWQPPVSGEIIMKTFAIGPGKEIGIIKNSIREAILDGIIANNYDEAYDFMIKEGEILGLKPKNNII